MDNGDEQFDLEDDRNFVTALARGLDVLRCFRPDETTLTNQEIAARTGLPKATISRLTYTLRKLGYLIHSERTGTYRLGAGVLALGYGVLAGMEIGELAKEEMRKLCEGPNPHVTAALGERHRLQMVYMAVRRSNQAVSLTMNVGARLPLFHSSMGRAALAGMSHEERSHMVHLAIMEKPEEEVRIRKSVERAVEDYKRFGYATSFGDWRSEVNGIAVPIWSLNGDRLYAMNIGGPSFLCSPEMLQKEYGSRLVEAGRALSQQARPGIV
ncbi:helix-turn-helix domain-containing protein [Stappia sp. GBMRC 2046]|uniref:Helix-turn-helix domain-containing protein n=1 Tax=Stappia sediminis TaxID=2692190 RepID=A0A7X3S908_9HYPH|nr:IclR family transcriptional regulator [Stappia sediminis]MXN66344.1 helix-turn-helix domain-containing protein [Stappia sediminis]